MMRYKGTTITKSAQGNLDVALELAEAGIPVFPAELVTRKGKLVKKPCFDCWQDDATTDADQLRRWWLKRPDAIPAIPTGSRSGISVLDLDRKNGKDGFKTLRELGHYPDALSPHTIKTASGAGQHFYFRHMEGLRNSTDKIGRGVDVRAEGGFVVAPGAISSKGSYGRLSGPVKRILADLPEWPADLQPPTREPRQSSGEKTGLPFEEFRDALMEVPNDDTNPDAESRDWWVKMLAAVHHETDGSEGGLELVQDWSAQHDTYDPEKTESVWRSFRRGEGATGATVLREARKRGWRGATERAELDALIDSCWTPKELAELAASEDDLESTKWTLEALDAIVFGHKEANPQRLKFLSPGDCEELPARQYVIKGLLAAGDVATIVGAPGAGKSLLAPYLGYMVARGETVFDRRTRKGTVFYVAAEDPLGMRARVKALREEHGDADGFRLVEGVSDLLRDKSPDLTALDRAVKEERPSLIFIDTVALAFPGLEENDAKSMGRAVAVARSLTKWRAAVVLIHHDTKDGANGLPRGHSILNGALDLNLYLKREHGAVTGKLTKNRNGTTDAKLSFTVATVNFGEDEDGDPITTAICQEADASTITTGKPLTAKQNAALGILVDMIGDRDRVAVSEWRKACIESPAVSAAEVPNDRRKAFRRIFEELAQRGEVFTYNGFVSTGELPENLLSEDDVRGGT